MPRTEPSTSAEESSTPTHTPVPEKPGIVVPGARLEFDERYRVRAELGRGGMGRVLVARDESLRREVALKELLRKDNAAAMRRFEREALLTARLQHPGIVGVYEFARRASGEPVLVMRRVQGRPLEEAIAKAPSAEARLALLSPFIAACDAVAYAHRQGVIHRDLKPGNVLLGEFGDTVVIDWGLAKELSAPPDSDEEHEPTSPGGFSQLTIQGAVMGTPAYMAPEQARGEPADERSDVYALGAILYQLLGGRRPYSGDSKEVLAAVRRGPPPAIERVAPGVSRELAAIAARAMARSPKDRYHDAFELAEDLKNFQTGRLVRSHSYSTRELLMRWARRHAALLTASAIFLAVLAALGAVSVRRVVAERDRANREAEVSRRVSDFMVSMFSIADPNEARGKNVTARELLDKAAQEVDGALAKDPLIQARLQHSIGGALKGIGLYSGAEQALRKSVETQRRVLGPRDRETLVTLSMLGNAIDAEGRYPDAEAALREAADGLRARFGSADPDAMLAMQNLAAVYTDEGKYEGAEKINREVVAARTAALGPEHAETLAALNNLAASLRGRDRYPEKEQIYRKAIDAERRTLGPDHPDTLRSTANLARVLVAQNKLEEGARLAREVLEARKRVLGPEHPDTLSTAEALAAAERESGHFAESARLYGEVASARARLFGPSHPATARAQSSLGYVLVKDGKFADAEQQLRPALEVQRKALGPDHPYTLMTQNYLAEGLKGAQKFAEAEAMARQTIDSERRVLGPDDADTIETTALLAAILSGERRFGDARQTWQSVLEARERKGMKKEEQAEALRGLAVADLGAGEEAKALDDLRREAALVGTAGMSRDPDLFPLRRNADFQALLRK